MRLATYSREWQLSYSRQWGRRVGNGSWTEKRHISHQRIVAEDNCGQVDGRMGHVSDSL